MCVVIEKLDKIVLCQKLKCKTDGQRMHVKMLILFYTSCIFETEIHIH